VVPSGRCANVGPAQFSHPRSLERCAAVSGHVDSLEAATSRRLILFVFLALMLGFVAGASAGQNPTRKPKSQRPYFVGTFNTCDFSQWHTQGLNPSFRIIRSPKVEGPCAAALTVGPWAINGVPNGTPSDGAALWLDPASYGTAGYTVWQHFSVQFPAGFRATPREWNWFAVWHNDKGFQKFAGLKEYGNLCWTVRKRHGVTRIAMRIMGGPSATPRTVWVTGGRLRTAHWYDFRVRTIWSPDPTIGVVQWWLDGKRIYSRHIATLYRRPDGSLSTVYFLLSNYRMHADWDASILFDGTRLGPTRSSIRY
jgi:Polysaccharide lyase